MLEESVSSVPSIWTTVNSWFTPTVLFVFLNLMIATIALSSSLSKPNHHEQENPEQEQEIPRNLQRSPSVLQRLKSISCYSLRSPPTVTPHIDYGYSSTPLQEKEHENGDEKPKSPFARSPSSVLQRLKSFTLYTNNSSPETAAPSPPNTDSDHRLQKPLDGGTRLSFSEALEEEGAREEEFGAEDGREEEKELEELEGQDRPEEQSCLDEVYSQLKGNQVTVFACSVVCPFPVPNMRDEFAVSKIGNLSNLSWDAYIFLL